MAERSAGAGSIARSTRMPGFTATSAIAGPTGTYRSPAPTARARGQVVRAAQSLLAYDPRWPQVFDAERRRIAASLGRRAAIEHVGSSSVPGLRGRPEIDVLVGVTAPDEVEPAARSLKGLGYTTSSASFEDGWCLLSKPGTIPFEVLVVQHRSPLWHRHLGFREYLRGDPARAAAYARLKSTWAARFGAGSDGYKDAKRRFWISVGEAARRSGGLGFTGGPRRAGSFARTPPAR